MESSSAAKMWATDDEEVLGNNDDCLRYPHRI
jgi:hypothetical protein